MTNILLEGIVNTDSTSIKRISLSLVTLFVLLFALGSTAHATEFESGERVVINAGDIIDDDLFITGDTVEMNGTVKGDLFATGGTVTINGTVEGSLFIAGQTLAINGPVNGSVYGAGYSLSLGQNGVVDRNMYFAGYSLTTDRQSTINRSLYAAGYQVIHSGRISQEANLVLGALEVNGTIDGDLNAEVETVEGNEQTPPMVFPFIDNPVDPIPLGYRQGSDAVIGGQTNISMTQHEAEVEQGSNVVWRIFGAIWDRVGDLITLLLLGGLLLYFGPSWVERFSNRAQAEPLPSSGWGLCRTLDCRHCCSGCLFSDRLDCGFGWFDYLGATFWNHSGPGRYPADFGFNALWHCVVLGHQDHRSLFGWKPDYQSGTV